MIRDLLTPIDINSGMVLHVRLIMAYVLQQMWRYGGHVRADPYIPLLLDPSAA